jgi:glycosyltransferase 2 family protein
VRRLGQRILLAVAFGVVCYVGLTIYADAGKLGRTLTSFAAWRIALALLLASANYLVRFVKWHYYLRCLGERVPLGESLLVFLSGFVLTVTPGKLGEVVKSYLLKETRGIPMMRTAPIVVADRLTDLVGLMLLALGGVFTYRAGVTGMLVGAACIGGFLVVVSWRRLALWLLRAFAHLPLVGRISHKLEEAYDSMATLVRPAPLAVAGALSSVAWFFECVALYVVIGGFPGAHATLRISTFIYSSMTIAGALSFLPGGLGVTEAGMTGLLVHLGHGIDEAVAVGATFITRACTLWFAVLVGCIALAWLRRLTGIRADLAAASREPASSSPAVLEEAAAAARDEQERTDRAEDHEPKV